MKKCLFLMLFFILNVYGQDTSYVLKENSVFKIGNRFIERTVALNDENKIPTVILNKISGRSYSVSSNEFSLTIVFAGFGPAPGKKQNGENPSILTAKDFQFDDYKILSKNQGSKTLELKYSLADYLYSFNLNVCYKIKDDEPFIRKWIEISDSSEGIHFLDRINVEDIEFDEPNFTHGEFGQPVFNNGIFLGVEYPAVENIIDGNHLKMGYVIGEKITKNKIISYPSVIGVSSSPEKLEQSFMTYVDSIKVKGTRPFLLYNSWYDLRNPAIAEGPETIMNEKNVLNRIESFKKYMFEKHHIYLDAFVLDDGWDNYNSIWEIDTGHLPHKFTPFIKPLKEMNTKLGIWASPFCGYSNREKRVKWGSEHGYERTGEFLCFAGKKYKAQFEKKMVEYVKGYDLGYFKWDGFLLACNEPDHGHLPGIYSRTELIATYIHMMRAVRKINPDIFINITVGSWLSPWWLKYADCIWMQGEDYAYAEDVPSMNPRDKAITYRDAVLWDNFQNQKLLFPISSMMTHGIIKGRLNFLGGKNEALDSFTNEVMMYFGRGVMMWELYISPDLLTDPEWDAIASSLKWAKANKNVLSKTRMILGDPLKRESYGYVHLTKGKGIILLRNPYVDAKTINIHLDQALGDLKEGQEYFVKVVYPYKEVLPQAFIFPGDLSFEMNGYEILLLELVPIDNIEPNTPIGVRYDINENKNIILYGEAGSQVDYKTFAQEEISKINFEGVPQKVNINKIEGTHQEENSVKGRFSVEVPDSYKNSKIGFLIEPDGRLQDELEPGYEVKVNGNVIDPQVEQENGKWFWATVPVKGGENEIDYKIIFKDETKGKIGLWLMADQILQASLLNKKLDMTSEELPPKPYPSDINKLTMKINSYTIQQEKP